MIEGTSQPARPRRTDKVVLLAACASFLPLLLQWRQFRALFWYQDDWDLLDSLDRHGIIRWIQQPFAENLAPVFKLVWYAVVRGAGGGYTTMICSLWICHAANVSAFYVLLRRVGLSRSSALISALTVAVSWTNLETLGWSPQLSQLLCSFFLLSAVHGMLNYMERGRHLILPACLALASALCFARGMLAGFLMLLWLVLARRHHPTRLQLWKPGVALLGPTAAVLAAHYIAFMRFSGKSITAVIAMAEFAGSYLLLNPLYMLISYPGRRLGLAALLILGGIKISTQLYALVRSEGLIRSLLQTLLAFDIGNAILLGIGRYQTGWGMAASSRYQYVSLLCFAPFLVIAVAQVLARLRRGRLGTAALASACWLSILVVPWPRKIDQWVQWRGYDVRAQLAETAPRHGVALSNLTLSRTEELIRAFHLH